MFGIGAPELLIILFIVLLLFGAKKLPGLAQSLGSSVSSFKKGMRGEAEDPKTIDARADTHEPVPVQKSTSHQE